jgi:hypothetical protein
MRAAVPAVLAVMLLSLVPAAASAVTREEIVRLSKSGVSEDVILALVDRDKTIFSIDPDDLVTLKSEGVSEAVVLTMLKSGREEGEAAFAQQVAQAAADRASAAWLAPNVVVVGHGPDRPNTGYRDGYYFPPRPLYEEFVPAIRRSLCVAQVAPGPSHAAFKYVTDCPSPQLQQRRGKLAR